MKIYKEYEPVVSVILPTYNRATYLNKAIESVLVQSFESFELIIVDDGSKDNSSELVNVIINRNPNVRYMFHENRGVALSMNAGIKASAGKYITFLGSDDEYKSNHLEVRIEFMQNNPDVDLVHGGVEIIGDQYVYDKNNLSRKIHLSECIIGGTLFGRRNVFEELNGFKNLSYSPESDFYERCSKQFTIRKVDFQTYIYNRKSPNSITKNIQ